MSQNMDEVAREASWHQKNVNFIQFHPTASSNEAWLSASSTSGEDRHDEHKVRNLPTQHWE